MEQRPIDVRAFRRVNNITQNELAEFLGVSRGFISLIENGKAKLPDDKKMLIMKKGKMEMGWDVNDLIPAYKRLLILTDLLRSRLIEEGEEADEEIYLSSMIGLSSDAFMKILEGRGTFTRTDAEQIQSKIPDININWLMTGEGEVFIKEKSSNMSKLQKEIMKLHTEIRDVKVELMQIKEILKKIEGGNSPK